MHKKDSFITTHLIPAKTNGTLYYFPKTQREVYAFRVRLFSSAALFSSYGSVINIICPDLLCGYREGSQNSLLLHSVAQFSTNALPLVYPQPKHYLLTDSNIHHLKFDFVDQNLTPIVFNPVDGAYFIVDFYHHNNKQEN